MPKLKTKNKNQFILKIAPLVLILLLICIPLVFLLNKNNSNINEQALVNYIPNFEDLTVNDLPNFIDYQNTYDYNGHIILISFNKIVEYDTQGSKYVRINDPKVLGCIFGSAKIDNFLYISCNSTFPPGENLPKAKTIISSKIYKIDLNKGAIVQTFFGQEIPIDPSIDYQKGDSVFETKGARSNLRLGSRGNILYMSSWDGIEKMDTQTGKITLYSGPGEIKGGHELLGLNLDPNSSYIPAHPQLPTFISISPLNGNTHYLLSSDGLYSLTKFEFPQKLIDSKIELNFEGKSTFSQDKKYLLFIASSTFAYNHQGPLFGIDAYLINLDNKTLKNLSIHYVTLSPLTEKISKQVNRGYFEENNGTIFLKSSDTNKNILSVTPANSKIKLISE